jgi:hypothetical protein
MDKQAGGAYPWWQRTGDRAALWAFSSLLTFAISLVSLLRGGSKQPPAAD